MKKQTFLFIISILTLSLQGQENLSIDIKKSTINWFGEYTFYFGGHNGTINFTDGHFIKTGDAITGGTFTIDMNSIKCDDIKDEKGKKGLVDHLKNQDFFEVETYPTAKLTITEVKYHDPTHMRIEADMTIKGKTLPINFQAEVNFESKTMYTKFKIDRRRWDIVYQSSLKDGGISDAIGFEVTISL